MVNLPQGFLDEDDVGEALSKLNPVHQRVAGVLSMNQSTIPISLWGQQYIDTFLRTTLASVPQSSYKAFRGAIPAKNPLQQFISDLGYLSLMQADEFANLDAKNKVIQILVNDKTNIISSLFSNNPISFVSQQVQQALFSQVFSKGFNVCVESLNQIQDYSSRFMKEYTKIKQSQK